VDHPLSRMMTAAANKSCTQQKSPAQPPGFLSSNQKPATGETV
jgi:hypothetical protein